MKTKTRIFLIFLFLLINGAIYLITELNKEVKINLVLKDNLKTLSTHYKILLQTQKGTASTLYKTTINIQRVREIIARASSVSRDEKELLRDELRDILEFRYELAKEKGVLQYHFVLPNNESFLRMHKPEKYGDDLTDVRADFKYVNETHKPIRGFTQGRTSHGFRNTFPIFDNAGKYIGAMEISFSSDSFQWYLNNISQIHTHFLVSKTIFDSNTWKRDDMVSKYAQSLESRKYMMTLDKDHQEKRCLSMKGLQLHTLQYKIKKGMQGDKEFSFYIQDSRGVEVISLIPIQNIMHNNTAWLVSFEKSPFIDITITTSLIARILGFFISLILIYFLVLQVKSKIIIDELLQKTKKKAYTDGLTKVFNRNKFDEVFEDELQRVHRYSNQLSIAIIDIDNFKEFNDTYGHLVGDEVLVMLAHSVDSNLRGTDTFARWGGEEFVILFKETYVDTAKIISIKLKDKIEALHHPKAGTITASFGLTQYVEGDTAESIFERCDEALYKAKAAGKNRVEVL